MACAVLAWFVVFLAVAGMAPLVQAQSMDMDSICTSAGFTKSGPQGEGPSGQHDHTLKCSLCTGGSAPPPTIAVRLSFADALAHALWPVPAAHLASLTRAPLPARGPPLFS
jgi:hypothetical protein